MPGSGFTFFFYLSTSLKKLLLLFQIQTVMAIVQSVPSEEDCNELGLVASKCSAQANPFKITGYISKPDHGMGRSSADRQFLYVNKRPCELSKVSRVINEVYHMFNRHQYPFVMIDISLARGLLWFVAVLLLMSQLLLVLTLLNIENHITLMQ